MQSLFNMLHTSYTSATDFSTWNFTNSQIQKKSRIRVQVTMPYFFSFSSLRYLDLYQFQYLDNNLDNYFNGNLKYKFINNTRFLLTGS